jgi:alkanesulfonate monooxygenase SsuD/methylene tetrahydromethanopterin reductase-like flavin-dependent oxidoreductase (luciferase family)
VKVGITLPTFEPTASPALAAARAAEEAGIDGVFVFDHLWPGASKSRPALSMYPVLAAVASTTHRIRIGSLVARVGLLPDRLISESFASLDELSGHRIVAALGIGDAKSASENRAYGIAWPAPRDRRASLAAILADLTGRGIECWVGASAPATLAVARAAGAAVNLWDVGLERLETESALGPATWAGPFPAEAGAAAQHLLGLRAAGAAWAIWGWPRSIDLVTEALWLAGLQDRGEQRLTSNDGASQDSRTSSVRFRAD